MQYIGRRFAKFDVETGQVTGSVGLDPDLMTQEDRDNWLSLGYVIQEIVMVDQQYWIMGFQPVPSLDRAKGLKVGAIRLNAKKDINAYEQDYSILEKESWVKQEKGAKLILDNPQLIEEAPIKDTNVQFIVSLAQKRGLDTINLCQRILSRVSQYNNIQSTSLARQRNKEVRVALATTIEEVEAIEA